MILASFRDADDTRPMKGRLLASAVSHSRGWTLRLSDGRGTFETTTFDAVVSCLISRTGLTHVLIIWSDQHDKVAIR